jgi:hypothetical protein
MVDIAAIAFMPTATTKLCQTFIPIPSQRQHCRLIPSQVKTTFHLSKNTVTPSSIVDDTTRFNSEQQQEQQELNPITTTIHPSKKSKKYPRIGNFPDVEWQAIPMDHLRYHPQFDELPPTLNSLSCLEDVRSFRQDSWQWEALHSGRCTTSQAAAALGFLEPKAGKALQIPTSWRRGGVGAFYRMKEPALRTLEEMRQVLCSQTNNNIYNNYQQQQLLLLQQLLPPQGTTARNNNIWKNQKNSKFPFAAKYIPQMTTEERERRRNHAKQHPVRTMAVKMMWGNTQEATAVLTALNYFWKEYDKNIRIKEVGMCGAGLSDNTTKSLLIGASPDALLCYPNGTMEVLEVKNHCPFVSTKGRSGKIFAIREMPFQQPYLPPLYVSQMMMEMKCVGPECRSAVMVRQSATSGALILRLHRDNAWLEEMMHWLNTFQVEFVDQEIPPPSNFFWQDERYRRFVNRTKDLGSSVEVLKDVPHYAIQRMSGQSPNSTSLFLD